MSLRRFVVLPLFLFAALGWNCAGEDNAASPTGPSVFEVKDPPVYRTEGIRIGTFNGEWLFDGVGNEGADVLDFPWRGDSLKAAAHRRDVAAVIRLLDADVLVMAETENLGVLETMAREDLPHLGYTPYLIEGRDTFTGQDVGLLSRLPVEMTGRTDERVEVGVTEARYGVSKNLWVRLMLGDTPITLIGVHFLAEPDNRERRLKREAQAEVIRRLVVAEMAQGREVIVIGDLNDFDDITLDRLGNRPISDVLAIIKRAGPGPDDDLVNAMAEVPQERRFTSYYDRNDNNLIDRNELSAIDHILLSPGLFDRVREVTYVHAHDPREVSDHFPVIVTLAP